MKGRLYRLSKISSKNIAVTDSVGYSKKSDRRAFDVLEEAQSYWSNMSQFRKDRERAKRYVYGDQWGDMITVDGKRMTEEKYILEQGNIPLKNNLMRRMISSVIGVYKPSEKEPVCVARDRDEQELGETMSGVLQYNMQLNRLGDVYSRCLEEFLISGFVVVRKWFGWRNDKLDEWTDYVSPNNFFIDSNTKDFRGWDCSLVGEIHDISFETLCEQYATCADDCERFRQLYHYTHDKRSYAVYLNQFGYEVNSNYDFFVTTDSSRCRVIEIWRKESKARYRCHDYNTGEVYKIDVEDYKTLVEDVNNRRLAMAYNQGISEDEVPLIEAEWFIDNYWYYYYLTPFGDILKEGETPYAHKSHPYIFKAFPFIDGEIHSFASDVIDQQRYVNRLITMHDWITRSTAKGVLMFPEECLPDNMDINDIADEWTRVNGVILIKTRNSTSLPQQIAVNSTNIGINELLNIQLKMFEDVSGVNGALQGKSGWSGMSASLYAQQAQNATTTLVDLQNVFSSFIIDCAYKDIKNIQQFYDTKRTLNIVGFSAKTIVYDPNKIKDIEFDVNIVEGAASPVYRALSNDMLMEMWRGGQIGIEQLLEVGDFPFADKLLQSIRVQKDKAMEEQQQAQLQQQMQQPQELQQ